MNTESLVANHNISPQNLRGGKPGTTSKQGEPWSLLYWLVGMRCGLILLLGVGSVVNQETPLWTIPNPRLFIQVWWVYAILALFFVGITRWLRTVFRVHVALQVFCDITLLTFLLNASGGIGSGLGTLILFPLAMGAAMSPLRTSMAFASIAALALLGENTYWVNDHYPRRLDYVPVGLLGMGGFLLSLVINHLARRLSFNQELLRKQSVSLQNQIEISQAALRSMPTGVLALDAEGIIVLVNPEANRLLGEYFQPGAYAGEYLPVLEAVRHDEVSIMGGTIPITINQRRLLLRVPNIPQGPLGNTLFFIDDAEHLGKESQKMKLAALGRLSANIAHEIRNPLSAISHATALLEEEQKGEANVLQQRLLALITQNTLRLNRIVEDVLQLGRRDRLVKEQFGLKQFLEDWIKQLTPSHIPHEGIEVYCPHEIGISFDQHHLSQILWNLIINAWRYSEKKKESVRLNVWQYPARNLELHVQNDGADVAGDHVGQLFEPFFTTSSEGTGLGLYIARELAQANDSRLDYISSPNRRQEHPAMSGADFCLYLKGV